MPKKPVPRKLTQKQSVWTALFIILFVILVGFIGFSFFRNYQPRPITTPSVAPQSKTYHSDVMDFTIEVPSDFTIEEKAASIVIYKKNETIFVGRNGTNYNNLRDYIKYSKNNLNKVLLNRQISILNGLESINGIFDKDKNYFFYADNFVYILSTEFDSLYDTLDQIAQSFKYTPD